MNLVSGWNQLMSAIPSGLLTGATVIGVAMIAGFVLKWVYDSRKGGGTFSMKTFPWGGVLIGGALAGPQLIVPALLLIVGVLLTIIVALLTWFAGLAA